VLLPCCQPLCATTRQLPAARPEPRLLGRQSRGALAHARVAAEVGRAEVQRREPSGGGWRAQLEHDLEGAPQRRRHALERPRRADEHDGGRRRGRAGVGIDGDRVVARRHGRRKDVGPRLGRVVARRCRLLARRRRLRTQSIAKQLEPSQHKHARRRAARLGEQHAERVRDLCGLDAAAQQAQRAAVHQVRAKLVAHARGERVLARARGCMQQYGGQDPQHGGGGGVEPQARVPPQRLRRLRVRHGERGARSAQEGAQPARRRAADGGHL